MIAKQRKVTAMKQEYRIRRSHCTSCGKRLSIKTSAGKIAWQPSQVDDKGIYCAACSVPPKSATKRGNARA